MNSASSEEMQVSSEEMQVKISTENGVESSIAPIPVLRIDPEGEACIVGEAGEDVGNKGKKRISSQTRLVSEIDPGLAPVEDEAGEDVQGDLVLGSAVGSTSSDFPQSASSTSPSSKLEEFINSPRGQNAIVERSPGGRYVRFLERLGSGASKDVYRAYDTTEGIEVAWNVVNLSGVPKTERNRIVNEVRLLERLHHQNIISFHGSWVNRERQEVNFVTEILSSGTLKSFINKVQVIRWKIAKRWAVQILKGLEYLHSQEPLVIHRDLKCENIFINGTSGDLRIGDLGLSTVHRNGKVLSVLGTPEFMAPDLYEEAAYDEKVDIYAFGMCLLEIFTKEIPYRECSNPAQIYKKVMRGEPPESLARVRSREARDFIMLCLGRKGENGKYVRPSASELLGNGFLAKSVDDDSEVVIDPPMQDLIISEVPEESLSSDPVCRPTKMSESPDETVQDAASHREQSQCGTENNEEAGSGATPLVNYVIESSDEDDSDKFSEMPDSEVNIKKVKVLMGRGQELEESSSGRPSSPGASGGVRDSSSILRAEKKGMEGSTFSPPHYLVAVAVIEEEAHVSRPYPDDMLKLIVTLPVEGQTQNVQFDFHLVQDDPVKVAKEMVTELNIPQEAVLEISETISGLACSARMKQDKYNSQQKHVLAQKPASLAQSMASPEQKDQAAEHADADSAQNSLRQTDTLLSTDSDVRSFSVSSSVSRTHTKTNPRSRIGHLPAGQRQQDHLQSPSTGNGDRNHTHRNSPKAEAVTWEQDRREINEEAMGSNFVSPDENSQLPNDAIPSCMSRSPDLMLEIRDATHNEEVVEDTETDSDGDNELSQKIRVLDENYQKNLMRAQRVFDSRMDSLHRSKEEKEAQHLKTLEKHERERAEFEKRLEAEAKEQSRRMKQLQLEWDRRRESLAKQRDCSAKKKYVTHTTDPLSVSSAIPRTENREAVEAETEETGTSASTTLDQVSMTSPDHIAGSSRTLHDKAE